MHDREGFVGGRRERWQRLEDLLRPGRRRDPESWSELAVLYRAVCADLARAQTLDLPDDIQRYLDRLSSRAYNALYRSSPLRLAAIFRTMIFGVPRTVRREWRFVLAAHVLLYLPFAFGLVGAILSQTFAGEVLSDPMLESIEAMYTDTIARNESENFGMAGFYVWNNVGIAFRCFVTGAFGGLGSVFYLVYNGLVLGTLSGFLLSRGLGGNLVAFTASHTPWELTGIALSGAAGLRLGYALFITEGRTRRASLAAAGTPLFRLMLGAFILLVIAALIEGFWSASPVPDLLKFIFAGAGFAVVGGWLLGVGRGGPR